MAADLARRPIGKQQCNLKHLVSFALDSPILPGKKRATPAASYKLSTASYEDSIRRALLNHFAASIILIDRKGQILQFHGQTVKYLDMPTRAPTLNLLDIAKEGLALKIRSTFHQALSENKTVVMDNVRIAKDPGSSFVRVTVSPIASRGDAESLFAVIFEDFPRPAAVEAEAVRDGENAFVMQLENELRATQQDLQSAIEEQQASNQELRLAGRGLTTTNH